MASVTFEQQVVTTTISSSTSPETGDTQYPFPKSAVAPPPINESSFATAETYHCCSSFVNTQCCDCEGTVIDICGQRIKQFVFRLSLVPLQIRSLDPRWNLQENEITRRCFSHFLYSMTNRTTILQRLHPSQPPHGRYSLKFVKIPEKTSCETYWCKIHTNTFARLH